MGNLQVEIRNAKIEDAPDIASLSNQLGYQSSFAETTKRLKKILKSKEHAVYVACQINGIIVGWIHVFSTLRVESDSFCEIGGLVVAEPLRGQGVGTELLMAAQHWTEQNGTSKLRVRSRIERTHAKQFYLDMGFSISKEQLVFEKEIKLKV